MHASHCQSLANSPCSMNKPRNVVRLLSVVMLPTSKKQRSQLTELPAISRISSGTKGLSGSMDPGVIVPVGNSVSGSLTTTSAPSYSSSGDLLLKEFISEYEIEKVALTSLSKS